MSATIGKVADMVGDNHGDKTQEEPQAQENLGQQQAAQDQPQVSGTDWEKAVAERDEKIAALEAQVAEAAKRVETADALRNEIAELKAQRESGRIDFRLQLAGVRDVKAARAVQADYDNDIDALKEAECYRQYIFPQRGCGGDLGSRQGYTVGEGRIFWTPG